MGLSGSRLSEPPRHQELWLFCGRQPAQCSPPHLPARNGAARLQVPLPPCSGEFQLPVRSALTNGERAAFLDTFTHTLPVLHVSSHHRGSSPLVEGVLHTHHTDTHTPLYAQAAHMHTLLCTCQTHIHTGVYSSSMYTYHTCIHDSHHTCT